MQESLLTHKNCAPLNATPAGKSFRQSYHKKCCPLLKSFLSLKSFAMLLIHILPETSILPYHRFQFTNRLSFFWIKIELYACGVFELFNGCKENIERMHHTQIRECLQAFKITIPPNHPLKLPIRFANTRIFNVQYASQTVANDNLQAVINQSSIVWFTKRVYFSYRFAACVSLFIINSMLKKLFGGKSKNLVDHSLIRNRFHNSIELWREFKHIIS